MSDENKETAEPTKAPEVMVREGGNLHRIMEAIDAIQDRQKDLMKEAGDARSADGEQFSGLNDSIAKLKERCDHLDDVLPRGSKIFSAPTATRNEALNDFGRCITEAWRSKTQGRVSAEFQEELDMDAKARAITDGGQTTVTGQGTGNVVVPVVTHDKIARIIGETSIIRKIASIMPMTSNTMNLPTKGSGPTVYWPSEGQVPTKTSVLLNQKQLVTSTLMALDEITSELTEDSVAALEPFFAEVFAEAVAAEENQQAFSSSVPFTGVGTDSNVTAKYFGDSAGSGLNAFSDVTHQDLVRAMFAVDSKVISKGVWVMSAGAFQHIVGLKDSQNRPIYQTSWNALPQVDKPADQIAGTATILMGRPCFLTDAMPGVSLNSELFAVYGDFKKFAFGDRKELRIDWSDQVYFEASNLALRVRERIAMVNMIPSAFSRLLSAA